MYLPELKASFITSSTILRYCAPPSGGFGVLQSDTLPNQRSCDNGRRTKLLFQFLKTSRTEESTLSPLLFHSRLQIFTPASLTSSSFSFNILFPAVWSILLGAYRFAAFDFSWFFLSILEVQAINMNNITNNKIIVIFFISVSFYNYTALLIFLR